MSNQTGERCSKLLVKAAVQRLNRETAQETCTREQKSLRQYERIEEGKRPEEKVCLLLRLLAFSVSPLLTVFQFFCLFFGFLPLEKAVFQDFKQRYENDWTGCALVLNKVTVVHHGHLSFAGIYNTLIAISLISPYL